MPNSEKVVEFFSGALSSVLEEMAFIFTDELSREDIPADPGKSLLVEMGFQGDHSGKISLVAQLPLCHELAVNILGTEEEEVTDTMASDALKEVLNMACGQFLTSLFGTEPLFDLTVPEVSKAEPPAWADILDCPGSLCLAAEDWQLAAGIRIEEQD